METNIGKKVIIRGDRSGAEFGTLVAQNGREVTLHNVRRLWYWDGAASLSQLAKDGKLPVYGNVPQIMMTK